MTSLLMEQRNTLKRNNLIIRKYLRLFFIKKIWVKALLFKQLKDTLMKNT